jgi:hypothetical protein
MTGEKAKNVVSLSGQPIYHHDEPSPFSVPQGEEFIEEISNHIVRHLGPVPTVLHEIVSDTVHIDVHIILPNEHFDGIRLVTSGMSDLPMTVPDGSGCPEFAELLVTLPAHWKLDQESFKDEAWYWPIRLLKYLARLPHKHNTWLGFGHTIPNGDPAERYAPGVQFNGAIILPSVTTPPEFSQLSIPNTKSIQFYSVVPLFQEEMELKLRKGSDELLERFDKNGINDFIRLERKNVAKRRIWPLG